VAPAGAGGSHWCCMLYACCCWKSSCIVVSWLAHDSYDGRDRVR
jgi:hypothetical protein